MRIYASLSCLRPSKPYLAAWTSLSIDLALGSLASPSLDQLVASAMLLALDSFVPRCLTREAPNERALDTFDLQAVLLGSSFLQRLHFDGHDGAASRACLLVGFLVGVNQKLVELDLHLDAQPVEDLRSVNALAAVGVRTRDFHRRVRYLDMEVCLEASVADREITARPKIQSRAAVAYEALGRRKASERVRQRNAREFIFQQEIVNHFEKVIVLSHPEMS